MSFAPRLARLLRRVYRRRRAMDHEQDEARATITPGERFGAFTIVRELGRGAFGAVYEARREPIGRRVALKLLHTKVLDDQAVVDRFVQEARVAASLKHPHIVDVEDVGEIAGRPYLVMEFLDGRSLGDLIAASAPLSVARTLEIMLPVFSAVAAIHDKGIVHRDLKPDNVFLWESMPGQVHPKLLDFGVAKAQGGELRAEMTATGTQMGTPLYMSPEQWESARTSTPRSDQWALAVILFRCLTGRYPFDADSIPALVSRVTLRPPERLGESLPDAPEALERAIVRALEKRPEQRYASVREFGAALLPLASPAVRERWSAEFGGPRRETASELTSSMDRVGVEATVSRETRASGSRIVLAFAGLTLAAASVIALSLAPGRAPPRVASQVVVSPIPALDAGGAQEPRVAVSPATTSSVDAGEAMAADAPARVAAPAAVRPPRSHRPATRESAPSAPIL